MSAAGDVLGDEPLSVEQHWRPSAPEIERAFGSSVVAGFAVHLSDPSIDIAAGDVVQSGLHLTQTHLGKATAGVL